MSVYPSLEAALRTCKVDTGWANRIQSDRFENPNLMVCPVWSGRDLSGRPVCADSFYTKRAGCNSALDRIDVENALRPNYSALINLDPAGYTADIYKTNMAYQEAGLQTQNLKNIPRITGQFGSNPNYGTNVATCENYPKRVAQAQIAQAQRQRAAKQQGMLSNNKRRRSGN